MKKVLVFVALAFALAATLEVGPELVEGERQDLIPRAGFAVSKFEQAFTAIASTKGRFKNEDGKSLRDLERENETLRTLIADVLLENARLKGIS